MSEIQVEAENTAPVETADADAEPVETTSEEPAPSGTEPAASEDTSSWTTKAQKRYDELTEARYREAARADRAEYQIQELQRKLQEKWEAEEKAKPETVAPSNDFPTLESVGWDESKHAAAVAEWSAKQAREVARAELAAEREAARREQFEQDWSRKQSDFVKSKPDYMEKVGSLPRHLMTDSLAAEIKEAGNPEIAYYLAENRDALAVLARLSPTAQAREIGRIEARLEAAKSAPPPVSKTPPPPSRIDAASASATVRVDTAESDSLSDAEWNRRRTAQERARLRKARGG